MGKDIFNSYVIIEGKKVAITIVRVWDTDETIDHYAAKVGDTTIARIKKENGQWVQIGRGPNALADEIGKIVERKSAGGENAGKKFRFSKN